MSRRRFPRYVPPVLPHNPSAPHAVTGYALQGFYWFGFPCVELELLIYCAARGEHRCVRGRIGVRPVYRSPEAPEDGDWRVIGYRYADGTLPHGPHHAIDVTMVDLDKASELMPERNGDKPRPFDLDTLRTR